MSLRVATLAEVQFASVAAQASSSATTDESPNMQPQSNGIPLTEFTVFPKLPLETRLHIWSSAAPKPTYVVQIESQKVGRRFHYIREIPALLHACRESRIEYLETDDPKDTTLQRRRLAHPVYKIHFQNRSTRNGVRGYFMSTEIDTLCGLRYAHSRAKIWNFHEMWSTLKGLCISATLTHVVVTQDHNALDRSVLLTTIEVLPALQVLTMVMYNAPDEYRSPFYGNIKILSLSEEIDGVMDLKGIDADPGDWRICDVVRYQDHGDAALKALAAQFPNKKLPIIKWRFAKQLMKNERISLPPPQQEEDPLKEMDQEMRAIGRRKNQEKKKKKSEKDMEERVKLRASDLDWE